MKVSIEFFVVNAVHKNSIVRVKQKRAKLQFRSLLLWLLPVIFLEAFNR